MFSILIPSYNNLEYLKTCIDSLKKNSEYTHQIIVHINEGTDGSLEYVKEKILNILIRKTILVCLKLLINPLN